MGADPLSKLGLLAAGITEGISPGRHLTRPVTVAIRLEGQKFQIQLAERSDFLVLAALRSREFAVDLPSTPEVVLDGGAHVGLSSLFFRARYPHAKILAVEPNPASYLRLVRNTADAGVQCTQAALAEADGELTLYLGATSWDSSLKEGVGGHAVTVRAISLDSFVEESSVDRIGLLKLDIEGAEFAALRATSILPRVDAIVAELHFEHGDGTEQEIRDLLSEFDISIRYESQYRAIMHAVRLQA